MVRTRDGAGTITAAVENARATMATDIVEGANLPSRPRTATTLSGPISSVMKSPGFGMELTWQTICQLGARMRSCSSRVICGWLYVQAAWRRTRGGGAENFSLNGGRCIHGRSSSQFVRLFNIRFQEMTGKPKAA